MVECTLRVFLALLLAGPALAQTPGPRKAHREAAPGPLSWTAGESRRLLCEPGRVWRLTAEKAVAGTAVEDSTRTPIEQTRIRIAEMSGDAERVLAYAQHINNTEVALLPPGDPRLDQAGPALNDAERPWPSPCRLDFYDLDRPIDFNGNGRGEIVLRRFATLAEPAATGLLLVESDETGAPRFVQPREFVGTIRFDQGIITAITWLKGSADPVLDAEYLPLYKCRFLAQLGLRGESGCDNCCMVHMVIQRDSEGVFQPVYSREDQGPLVDRLRGDLQTVMDGKPDQPLTSAEEAALARAAAFFYLTGTGWRTRSQLEQALGPRADQVRTKLLLSKLDRYFLLDQG